VVERPRKAAFATTRWSLVLAAASGTPSSASRDALATLCETYWYPLYAYLRSRGERPEDAEDLTQAFFARLVEKETIEHADPARGRFRSFLLASLKHFAANARDHTAAAKRGGGVALIPLTFEDGEDRFLREPSIDETPERIFDRRWAQALLARALARLDREMIQHGKREDFVVLRRYLLGDAPQLSYGDAAIQLGASAGSIKVAVHRMRRRFRDLVRDEIAQTVDSPEEVDDELRHLFESLGRS